MGEFNYNGVDYTVDQNGSAYSVKDGTPAPFDAQGFATNELGSDFALKPWTSIDMNKSFIGDNGLAGSDSNVGNTLSYESPGNYNKIPDYLSKGNLYNRSYDEATFGKSVSQNATNAINDANKLSVMGPLKNGSLLESSNSSLNVNPSLSPSQSGLAATSKWDGMSGMEVGQLALGAGQLGLGLAGYFEDRKTAEDQRGLLKEQLANAKQERAQRTEVRNQLGAGFGG